MSESLPVKNFKWHEKIEDCEEHESAILSVNLSIPKDLHKKLSDFPLCPEKENGKLLCTFRPKKNFVCHKKYLDFILEQGYILEKVNKVLIFDSEPWLKGYIEKNTRLRRKATADFEKDLWKTMNNAVYGKQIENVRKRVNIKLSTNENQLKKEASKHNFKNIELSETSNLLEMGKISITLNKPIYGGLVILDFSKIIMSSFFYNYLKPKFKDRYELLMTDTDSVMGLVQSEDFYKETNPKDFLEKEVIRIYQSRL